jgi:hypothetical protein
MMRKRGQEEAVGFVAIIVIVALVVVFFIGISIRHAGPQALGSASVKQFLESSSAFTTSCDLGLRTKYATLEQLMQSCSRNSQATCLNGELACQRYNETVQRLLDSTWKPSQEGIIEGYVFNVSYERQTGSEQVVSFMNGSCEGNFMAEEVLSPDTFEGGTFVTQLRICS